jgi:hypothetical protein
MKPIRQSAAMVVRHDCIVRTAAPCVTTRRGLAAECGWPVRTLTGRLVRAQPVVQAATKCGASCLSLVGPCICWRVGGTGDLPVEALFPEGRERFELASSSSGWARVLGIDAVGGPPHCDFADKCGVRVASRWCPDRRAVTLAGVVFDLVAEVGDELGSFCQVGPPDGTGMERCWNAWEPGQRTWVTRRERWEAPVEDGGDVACGSEVASGGGCQHVAQWGAFQFRRRGRAGGLAGSAKRVQW